MVLYRHEWYFVKETTFYYIALYKLLKRISLWSFCLTLSFWSSFVVSCRIRIRVYLNISVLINEVEWHVHLKVPWMLFSKTYESVLVTTICVVFSVRPMVSTTWRTHFSHANNMLSTTALVSRNPPLFFELISDKSSDVPSLSDDTLRKSEQSEHVSFRLRMTYPPVTQNKWNSDKLLQYYEWNESHSHC